MSVIKHFLISGDAHGNVEPKLKYIQQNWPNYNPDETALIILGDVGFQYYKNKKDWKHKHNVSKYGYTIYCLRGNHEDRISNAKGEVIEEFDLNVYGNVKYEPEFPNIKYFSDSVEEYNINGYSVLSIPGAYSVDKFYRLQSGMMWFPQEQLSAEEMEEAEKLYKGNGYDFIFSHTCPTSWEPSDLFLGCINQSTVDKSMENWMDKFKEEIGWGVWCFGHYHADRVERPYVEQYFNEVEDLDTVWNRWEKYRLNGTLDWWLPKSPMFYAGV